jgi:hypothetical protein
MASPSRIFCVSLLAGLSLALTGCGGEEPIQSYTVPRQPEPKRTTYRILGAMVPDASPVWYFKFTGSEEDLAKHEADFDTFAASIKHQAADKVPEFTLPAGWVNIGERTTTRMGITNRTDAVLKIGSKDAPLEVTVNFNDGGLVPNIKRWADQVDADYDANTLESLATPLATAGGKGLRVDFRGPKNPAGGPMMGKMR